MKNKKTVQPGAIAVYADWSPGTPPVKLGTLWPDAARNKEVFSFEFEPVARDMPALLKYALDPHLGVFSGRQYCPPEFPNFGVFSDSSPDRWGRMLMKRRLERQKRRGEAPKDKLLLESDYLLGVHDEYRVGALRFRLNDEGAFLDDQHDHAAPPFVQLRELEEASLTLERNPEDDSEKVDKWLKLLLSPGGSLGGARPKASVIDPQGQLWIAKFPSANDTRNVGAWELLAMTLAQACGLNVPETQAEKYSSNCHTFLIRRFDRTPQGRIHFASAMTLTGHKDGEDESTGVSYLELAEILIKWGADTTKDLKELWTRIVFNMCISNTDDHLRNHGFLLDPDRGWHLSPMYDVNPIPDGGSGLRLNVTEASNDLDLALALEAAPLFRVDSKEAQKRIEHVKAITRQWRSLAEKLGIARAEQNEMAPAFKVTES